MTKQLLCPALNIRSIGMGLLICFSTTLALPVFAGQNTVIDEQCLLEYMKVAQADMTVGEIRALCTPPEMETNTNVQAPEGGALVSNGGSASQRMAVDRKAIVSPYSILAHHPNYFLLAAYNAKGWDPERYRQTYNNPAYNNQDVEAQFQISLKVPLALDLFAGIVDIYGAYTNRSFWQMYN